jgi:hypothetical protein
VQPRPERQPRRHALEQRLALERQDHVDARTDLEAEERRLRDADNGERDAVEHDGASDDAGGAAETPLPEAGAQHGRGAVGPAAAAVVAFVQRPPGTRRDAECVEETPRGPDDADGPRLAVLYFAEAVLRPGKGAVEDLSFAQREPDRIRQVRILPGRVGRDRDEAVRIAHGQRTQQQTVENREDGGVGADAERE